MLALNGFSFSAATAGFKKHDRTDVALVVSDTPAVAAGVFTTNKFQAAPVIAGKLRLSQSPTARAVLINAGQANACTGEGGMEDCEKAAALVAQAAGLESGDILPASTGVIGKRMDMGKWEQAAPLLARELGQAGPVEFARAIMTTDAYPKISWAEAETDEGSATVLGICKGAGMICPNMATMLVVILTDAQVDPEAWQGVIAAAAELTFNRITVDGDTSTNDTVYGLANGASGTSFQGEEVSALAGAVASVCEELAELIVADAEGGTKVLRISVTGAADDMEAELAARAVGNSPLVKTAIYGRDANWGRIVAALGRSGARFEPEDVTVAICGVVLFADNEPTPGDVDGYLQAPLRKTRHRRGSLPGRRRRRIPAPCLGPHPRLHYGERRLPLVSGAMQPRPRRRVHARRHGNSRSRGPRQDRAGQGAHRHRLRPPGRGKTARHHH